MWFLIFQHPEIRETYHSNVHLNNTENEQKRHRHFSVLTGGLNRPFICLENRQFEKLRHGRATSCFGGNFDWYLETTHMWKMFPRKFVFSHGRNEDEHKSLKEVALFKDKTTRHNPCRQPISWQSLSSLIGVRCWARSPRGLSRKYLLQIRWQKWNTEYDVPMAGMLCTCALSTFSECGEPIFWKYVNRHQC